MNNDYFIYNEITKNQTDLRQSHKELEDFKRRFAQEMLNGCGESMFRTLKSQEKQTYKKNFKMKFKDFVNKIKYVFFS